MDMHFPVKKFWLFCFLIATLLISFNIIYSLILESKASPQHLYTYSSGHTGDFYAYTYMIRRGAEGNLLYHNIYTTKTVSDVFVMPFFHLLGMISSPFSLPPYIIFFIARLACLGILIIAVGKLSQSMFPLASARYVSVLIFISASAFWQIVQAQTASGYRMMYAFPYTDYFEVFKRIHAIPPHHLLAHALVVFTTLLLIKAIINIKTVALTVILTVSIGLLHPDILQFFLILTGLNFLITLVCEKDKKPIIILSFIVMISGVLTLTFEALQVINVLNHTSSLLTIFRKSTRTVSFATYAQLLGLLFPIGLISLFFPSTYRNRLSRFLVLWAVVPIGLFFFPDLGIDVSVYRLLQYNQYIPLSILTTLVLQILSQKIKRPYILHIGAIIFLTLGIIPYAVDTINNIQDIQPTYQNIYLPKRFTDVYTFLKENTPPDSIVLAGQTISSPLPTFAYNKSPLGHDSSFMEFPELKDTIYAMYTGSLSAERLQSFFKEFHISYVVFGVDAAPISATGYGQLPFMQTLYDKDGMTIVKVLN